LLAGAGGLGGEVLLNKPFNIAASNDDAVKIVVIDKIAGIQFGLRIAVALLLEKTVEFPPVAGFVVLPKCIVDHFRFSRCGFRRFHAIRYTLTVSPLQAEKYAKRIYFHPRSLTTFAASPVTCSARM
jgi:hypothetical protein